MSQPTLNVCKTVCVKAFEYAIIHKWIDRNDNYTMYIEHSSIAERTIVHRPFTKPEIDLLFKNKSIISKVILVYIFTGCRASELFNIKEYEGYIVCGIKTASGKNRKIPIHSYILPFIKEVIVFLENKKYADIYTEFKKHMELLNIEHTLHDTRNTFATLGKEQGMKPSVIKKSWAIKPMI